MHGFHGWIGVAYSGIDMIMLSVFGVPVEAFTTGHNCVAIKLSNTSVAILAESAQDFKLTLKHR